MSDELDARASYDRVAAEYAAHVRDELAKKPFDAKMLDWLAERASGRGVVCDMGSGPGQVARYLHDRGARACGIDFSPRMVAEAQALHPPSIPFAVGNMLDLVGVADGAYAGIVAFYAIVNLAPASLPRALSEMHRVLAASGTLLLAFHVGETVTHMDEWWQKKVSLDFYFHRTADVRQLLEQVGFRVLEVIEREPYPDVEYPSRRAYVFAQKP